MTTSPEISRLSAVGRALGDDLAVVHDRDPVAERVGLFEVVGGDEDGHALGAQPADLVPHVGPALRVEAGGRLVEEDDARLVDDAERDVDPPALAAGVGLALAVGVLGELERRQRPRRARLRLAPCEARTAGPGAPAPRGRWSRPTCCRPGRRSRCGGAPRPGRAAGRRRRWWRRRRRARSAWRACAASWSCRRRWARGSRRSRPPATWRSTPRTASTVFFSLPWRLRNDFRKPFVSMIIEAPGIRTRLVTRTTVTRYNSTSQA